MHWWIPQVQHLHAISFGRSPISLILYLVKRPHMEIDTQPEIMESQNRWSKAHVSWWHPSKRRSRPASSAGRSWPPLTGFQADTRQGRTRIVNYSEHKETTYRYFRTLSAARLFTASNKYFSIFSRLYILMVKLTRNQCTDHTCNFNITWAMLISKSHSKRRLHMALPPNTL